MKKQRNNKKIGEKKDEQTRKSKVQENKCNCEDLKSEIDSLTNSLKRALADYQNLKRRVEEDKKTFTLTANIVIFSALLDILDDFNLAIEKRKKEENGEDDWLSGIKMIKEKLDNLLETQNVREIEVKEGDTFDSKIHEAIGVITVKEESQDERIIGIARNGYKIGDEVLRPARVMIGKLEQK